MPRSRAFPIAGHAMWQVLQCSLACTCRTTTDLEGDRHAHPIHSIFARWRWHRRRTYAYRGLCSCGARANGSEPLAPVVCGYASDKGRGNTLGARGTAVKARVRPSAAVKRRHRPDHGRCPRSVLRAHRLPLGRPRRHGADQQRRRVRDDLRGLVPRRLRRRMDEPGRRGGFDERRRLSHRGPADRWHLAGQQHDVLRPGE